MLVACVVFVLGIVLFNEPIFNNVFSYFAYAALILIVVEKWIIRCNSFVFWAAMSILFIGWITCYAGDGWWKGLAYTTVAVGILANLLVMACNGFQMPVNVVGKDKGFIERVFTSARHTPMTENNKLSWLGDNIPIFNSMASMGDILVTAGLAILFFSLLFRRLFN
ncbi:MAG: DUF5317 family protein [Patescibacteria group bacterium]